MRSTRAPVAASEAPPFYSPSTINMRVAAPRQHQHHHAPPPPEPEEGAPPHAYMSNASIFETEFYKEGGHKPRAIFGTQPRISALDSHSQVWCSHLPGALPSSSIGLLEHQRNGGAWNTDHLLQHFQQQQVHEPPPMKPLTPFEVGRHGGATRWDRVGKPRHRLPRLGPKQPVPGSTLERRRNRAAARERERVQISAAASSNARGSSRAATTTILHGTSTDLPPPAVLFLPLRDPLRVILPRLPVP